MLNAATETQELREGQNHNDARTNKTPPFLLTPHVRHRYSMIYALASCTASISSPPRTYLPPIATLMQTTCAPIYRPSPVNVKRPRGEPGDLSFSGR